MAQRSDETSFDERKQSYLSGHLGLTLVLLLAGWTSLVAYSNHWNQSYLYREKVALATSEARSLWNKDMAFREWATRHGGVYVPPQLLDGADTEAGAPRALRSRTARSSATSNPSPSARRSTR